jgi:peroxiredoxin
MRWTAPLPFALCLALLGCDDKADAGDAKAKAATKNDDRKEGDTKSDEAKAEEPTKEAKAEPASPPEPEAKVGESAPDFELTDIDGKAHKLSDYAGKTVVLEWFNPQCPFVKFAHSEGPLEDMAAKEMEQGVVWLTINSGAPGKQGHGIEANKAGVQAYGMTNPVLLDEEGKVGRSYGALKTPHVFLIDDKGVLVYAGAIDNAPIGEVDGEGDKVNYLEAALADLRAGKEVATPQTKPYGCTVKY